MPDDDMNGGSFGDVPNDKYRQFFDKCALFSTMKTAQWKPAQLLGWFCYKYLSVYGKKYAFKYNSPSPSKSFELFQLKKLAQVLSADPSILKEYIDWLFLKVIKEKRTFTSISFLTREEIIKEYKMTILLTQKIDRSTTLTSEIKKAFISCGDFNTYGDVAFFQAVCNADGYDSIQIAKFQQALTNAIQMGFKANLLGGLK